MTTPLWSRVLLGAVLAGVIAMGCQAPVVQADPSTFSPSATAPATGSLAPSTEATSLPSPQDRPTSPRSDEPSSSPLGRPPVRGFGRYPGDPWTDRDGNVVAPEVLAVFEGPGHCGWGATAFMNGTWPLGSDASTELRAHWYRNIDGSLDRWLARPFVKRATLPNDAADTGYRNGDWELWLSPSDDDEYAYMARGDRVEAWPRGDTIACG